MPPAFSGAILAAATLIACASASTSKREAQSAPAILQLAQPVGPGEVVGLVVDSATGVPVGHAQLVAASPNEPKADTVLADSIGRFAFRHLGSAAYIVEVRLIGYCTKRVPVTVPLGAGLALIIYIRPARNEGFADVIILKC